MSEQDDRHAADTTPVPEQDEHHRAEHHAVADEPVHAVAHQEAQEPGDRRESDDEGDHGRDHQLRTAGAHPLADRMKRVGQREQPGCEHRGDREQEAEPRGQFAVQPEEQARR